MANLKNMPLLPKILIACLALGLIYRVSNRHDSGGYEPGPAPSPEVSPALSPEADTSGLLARYQQQYDQLSAQSSQCVEQLQAYQREMAENAMSGSGAMPGGGPACMQNMPQMTVQLALLQTYITRLKTGDTRITVCQANPGLQGCESWEAASRSSSSASSDPTSVVERSTRQGIRGNTIYYDAEGQEHELPTRDYYYRDRNSGQFVGSD